MNSRFPIRAQPATVLSVLTAEPEAGNLRVTVSGEIDMATAPQLDKALDAALHEYRPQRLEVDLAGVTLLDSTGIRSLLLAQTKAQSKDCRLVVTNPHPRVYRVLAITAVLERLGLPPAP
jgi:anti-sigma B factor antagonist